MSRIGKHPIKIADGASAVVADGKITVKGKLGELSARVPHGVHVTVQDKEIVVTPATDSQEHRALWGTIRANISNMMQGVSAGFSKKLELIGVGFRAQVQGQTLKLTLGYSHDIDYALPKGIKAVCPQPTIIELTGTDNQLLGQVASEIRSYRAPEPYKGKGVKYENETILRKVGKKK